MLISCDLPLSAEQDVGLTVTGKARLMCYIKQRTGVLTVTQGRRQTALRPGHFLGHLKGSTLGWRCSCSPRL